MVIKDIWYAIKMFFSTILLGQLIFIPLFFITGIICKLFGFEINLYLFYAIYNMLLLTFSILIYLNYSKGYIINETTNTFSFPASDVENSLIEIITMKRLRNLPKRNIVNINDIISLNNETLRKQKNGKDKTEWLLNMSGRFGSQQFAFNSKQKRDELRSALNFQTRGRNSSDINSDI